MCGVIAMDVYVIGCMVCIVTNETAGGDGNGVSDAELRATTAPASHPVTHMFDQSPDSTTRSTHSSDGGHNNTDTDLGYVLCVWLLCGSGVVAVWYVCVACFVLPISVCV